MLFDSKEESFHQKHKKYLKPSRWQQWQNDNRISISMQLQKYGKW